MISFVIPAHNEEACIGQTLRALGRAAAAVGEPFEVIVVNDASTDRTAEIVQQHGVELVNVAHRKIAATRNAGARRAIGDILFFVDADTQANASVIRAGLRALRGGAIGGGCLFRYDGPMPLWAHVLYPIGALAARSLELVGGCFLFCRRTDFDAVGGFCEDYYAAEDLVFIRALKRHGRFVVPRPTVLTSNRKLWAMTFGRALKLLYQTAFRGDDMCRRREELGLWYGPEARDQQMEAQP
jgi:glycosyltransferase involved in cell wall biosynthesis